MTWDPAAQRVLLFGGVVCNGCAVVGDTWHWDGMAWTSMSASPSPAARFAHGLATDPARGVVVLFGGTNTGQYSVPSMGDTWEWTGTAWMQRLASGGPPARSYHAMYFDPFRRRTVVWAGRDPAGGRNDTWEWDGSTWSQTAPLALPAPRTESGVAFDRGRGRLVMVGGEAKTDSWEYVTANPAALEVLGSGCAGPAGTPLLAATPYTLPWSGDRLEMVIDLVPAAAPVLIAMGFSLQMSGITLPLPLDPFGMPGCLLRVAPEATTLLPSTGGTARWSIQVPNQPALLGTTFHQQAAVVAIGWNAAGMVLSNAITGIIGNR